ncbi:MAG: FHA domain-containing protein, partial [Planctomycetes bacterium]|nr:FHA domain-containing protein [Planctomycetota bacterium]
MAKLIVERGSVQGKEFELLNAEHFFIGRAENASMPINDPMASRRHCVIANHKNQWVIKDLGSANGTNLNGRSIGDGKAHVLKHGSTIQIGEALITFAEDTELSKDPLLERTLAGYRIDKRLGRGAMGVVYQAHQM